MAILKTRRSQGFQAYRREHTLMTRRVKEAGKGETKALRQNKDKTNKINSENKCQICKNNLTINSICSVVHIT